MTMNILAFLEARIAEDEDAARTATLNLGGETRPDLEHWRATRRDMAGVLESQRGDGGRWIGRLEVSHHDLYLLDHAARFDPARMMAECKAKREILDYESGDARPGDVQSGPLLALAAIYAQHADYRTDW